MNFINPAQTNPGMNFGTFNTTIRKIVLQETGTYNTMHNRPYLVDATNGNVERAVAKMCEMSFGIEGPALTGHAARLIKPTTAVREGVTDIMIPNGWKNRRFRFIMEAEVKNSTGSTTVYFFQGFSDYVGASATGDLDPNMKLYVNSYMRIARALETFPGGQRWVDRVIETVQVMSNRIIGAGAPMIYGMRPCDMFSGIQTAHYRSVNTGDVYDTRSEMPSANGSFASSRANNLPTHYLATFMEAYQNATDLARIGQSNESILNRAQANAASGEALPEDNAVLRQLAHIQNTHTTTEFSLRDLQLLDPNIFNDRRVVYNKIETAAYNQLHHHGQTSNWTSTGAETQVAAQLANTIPAMMMESFVGNMRFTASNMAGGKRAMIAPISVLSIVGADVTRECNLLLNRIRTEVIDDITYNNEVPLDIDMSVDIFGESRISVRMYDPSPTVFCVPSFGDGLFAPVYTRDEQMFAAAATDMEILTNSIRSALVENNHSTRVSTQVAY